MRVCAALCLEPRRLGYAQPLPCKRSAQVGQAESFKDGSRQGKHRAGISEEHSLQSYGRLNVWCFIWLSGAMGSGHNDLLNHIRDYKVLRHTVLKICDKHDKHGRLYVFTRGEPNDSA